MVLNHGTGVRFPVPLPSLTCCEIARLRFPADRNDESRDSATRWPPNGGMTPVLFSGAVTDTLSGVDRASVRFVVTDEYGIVEPRGNVTIAANGTYSFVVPLEASRLGGDKDGRLYTIAVTGQDSAGNQVSRSTTVTVPHDKGK
jgi:hypothetical protein